MSGPMNGRMDQMYTCCVVVYAYRQVGDGQVDDDGERQPHSKNRRWKFTQFSQAAYRRGGGGGGGGAKS